MNYETQIEKAQWGNPHSRSIADENRARMTPEQQAAADAKLKADNERYKAEREAQRQAQSAAYEAEQNRAREEQGVQREMQAKTEAFTFWQGSKASFEAAWPAMFQQMQIKETLARMERARANHAEIYRGAF